MPIYVAVSNREGQKIDFWIQFALCTSSPMQEPWARVIRGETESRIVASVTR